MYPTVPTFTRLEQPDHDATLRGLATWRDRTDKMRRVEKGRGRGVHMLAKSDWESTCVKQVREKPDYPKGTFLQDHSSKGLVTTMSRWIEAFPLMGYAVVDLEGWRTADVVCWASE
jgi:hypothetical protein